MVGLLPVHLSCLPSCLLGHLFPQSQQLSHSKCVKGNFDSMAGRCCGCVGNEGLQLEPNCGEPAKSKVGVTREMIRMIPHGGVVMFSCDLAGYFVTRRR